MSGKELVRVESNASMGRRFAPSGSGKPTGRVVVALVMRQCQCVSKQIAFHAELACFRN